MKWAALLTLAMALPVAAQEDAGVLRPVVRPETPAVPSGQVLALFEVIREEGLQRWRFLAPGVRSHDIEVVLDDMQALCDGFVLPRLDTDAMDDEIVLNLMDRPVPFGQTDTDARQHFEAYRAADGVCIWEIF